VAKWAIYNGGRHSQRQHGQLQVMKGTEPSTVRQQRSGGQQCSGLEDTSLGSIRQNGGRYFDILG
jgi:hypothetical protein